MTSSGPPPIPASAPAAAAPAPSLAPVSDGGAASSAALSLNGLVSAPAWSSSYVSSIARLHTGAFATRVPGHPRRIEGTTRAMDTRSTPPAPLDSPWPRSENRVRPVTSEDRMLSARNGILALFLAAGCASTSQQAPSALKAEEIQPVVGREAAGAVPSAEMVKPALDRAFSDGGKTT